MDAKQAAQQSLQKQVENNGVANMNQDATDFRTQLEAMLPRLAEASLRGIKPEFLMSSALSLIRSNDSLRKCDKPSILHGIMQAALLGLRLDPVLGQACLVPRKGKAQFMPMYKGLVLLAHRSGKVRDVVAQVVYENDEFTIRYGSHRALDHVPAKGDRGKPLGAYGFISTVNGGEFFEYLTQAEIEKIRDKGGYDPQKASPWKSDTMAMWEKTAIKQALRLVPTDDPALSTAVALDDLEARGMDQRIVIEDGKLTHAVLSDEVPGDAAEETKRLIAAEPPAAPPAAPEKPKQDQALRELLGAPPLSEDPAQMSLLDQPSPPKVTRGELETDAERDARLAKDQAFSQSCMENGPQPRPAENWPDLCLSVVGGAVRTKPDEARKLAAEWYASAQTRLKSKNINQAEFDKIDKQFRAWFPPKPIQAEQLSLLDQPKPAPAPKPAEPVAPPPVQPAPPAEKPPMIAPTGIKVTKVPKDVDKETEAYEQFAAEIAAADKIPAILAVKSKIASSSALGDSAKKGLGQIAQDRFAQIKAGRK